MVQELRFDAWDAINDSFDGRQSKPSLLIGYLMLYSTANVASSIVNRYNDFVSRVEELGLPGCIDDKPLLNV